MNKNEVRKAFDDIEPEIGAQERMYANILKKATAQKENQYFAQMNDKPQKRCLVPILRRWGSLAACVAIIAVVCFTLPKLFDFTEQNDPPTLLDSTGQNDPPLVMAGSPVEDVSGVQDFEKLGFTIDAPEGAENISYCILNGEIAQVIFSLDGQEYTYRAAKLDGDFSGVNEEVVGSVSLNAKYDAILDCLSPGTWRAHWSRDGISFYLISVNGADEGTMTAAVKALLEVN